MLFVHKLEEILDPQIGDMIQTKFKSLCFSLFVFLETKYMKDVQKLTHKSPNRLELST